jgi:hypothetical protein
LTSFDASIAETPFLCKYNLHNLSSLSIGFEKALKKPVDIETCWDYTYLQRNGGGMDADQEFLSAAEAAASWD